LYSNRTHEKNPGNESLGAIDVIGVIDVIDVIDVIRATRCAAVSPNRLAHTMFAFCSTTKDSQEDP
jgi:hypothetical protein